MKSKWVGKILSVLLVAIWILVIFAYSAKSAEASTKQSMRFRKLLGKTGKLCGALGASRKEGGTCRRVCGTGVFAAECFHSMGL